MSNTTIALRSSGATGNVPNALSLAYGEFALNYADGIIYYRTDSNTVGSILTTQPSGLDTEVQFNDLGSFGSSANLSFNKTTGQLSTTRIYVAANAQIVGNVTANRLISNNSVGSSGGDILLAKPAANTTLSGLGITIDAFENKIRFFEQGGTNRGAYIDLTEASANVGTNLLTAGGGGVAANNVLQYRSSYTANGGQTVFAATYIPGYVDAFINGVRLTPGVDFTATNGTSITLSDAAVSNDSVDIIGYVTVATTLPDAIQHRYSYTANSAQTTFAAIYVAPYIDVYKNGGRLSFGDDFIANNGTTVVLTTGAALDDLIEIVGYSSYTATVGQADQLTTGRTIGMTGDVTWTSNSFNGTANVTGTSTLANTGVTAGTYTKVTVDAKGRVTTGNTLSYSDLPSYSGNLTFTGTGNRILGDFSNATVANRVLFQSSTTNGNTLVGAIPNGTAVRSDIILYNSPDSANASFLDIFSSDTQYAFSGNKAGTGAYLPMTFYTGGSERMRIESGGAITFKASGSANTTHSFIHNENGGEIQLHNAAGGTDVLFDSVNNTTRLLTFNGPLQMGSPNSHDIFFTSSGTEIMRITSAGNVGIGMTPSGDSRFEVYGADAATIYKNVNTGTGSSDGFYVGMAKSSGTDGYVYNRESANVIFGTANAERARIDSSGSVGIGTSSPGARLHVSQTSAGGSVVGAYLQNPDNNTNTEVRLAFGPNDAALSSNRYAWIGSINTGSVNATALTFANGPGGTAATERMRIDSSGNLGIGTTSFSQKLHVAGNAQIGAVASTDAILYVNPGSGTKGKTGFTWYGATFGASWGGGDTGHRMVFRSGASNTGADAWVTMVYDIDSNQSDAISWVNRFRINGNSGDVTLGNNGGNLLVGTTSGSYKFQVQANATTYSSYLANQNANPYGLYIQHNGASPNGAGNEFITFWDTTANRFRVNSNGGIANYQANDANLSDRREKTNFAPAKSYLDTICAIPVQTFNYIDQNMEEDPGLTLGVVAQDVQAVAPELVMESNWGTKDEPKMRLSIYQTDLQYALMKALQEQQAIIESLKARLDAANL